MHDPVAEALASIFNFFCELFPEMLDLNLTASIVILFVICVRQFLKGAPKIFSYTLWGIVLLRLLVPVSIESSVSVVPERTEFSSMVDVNDVLPSIEWEDARSREIRENTPPGQPMALTGTSVDPQVYLSFIWLAGMVFLTVRSLLSYLGLRKRVKVSIPFRKGIYIADDIDTPFVMGFFRPKIYLPGTLDPSERKYIIAHERHHIRRGDHIFKALGFLALTIHWFNPFVWLAFVLAGRDMEMSCDEAVIRKLGEDVRAEYSASLLNLATGQRLFAGTPLAFGEGDPTGRVRNLAKWKKPAFWVILICAIVCAVLAVCLLTDPSKDISEETHSYEQYYVIDKQDVVATGVARDSTIAVKFKKTSGPHSFVVDIQYKTKEDSAWTSLSPQTLEIAETCAFQIPAGSSYMIEAIPTLGSNGYATFEISDRGLYALADIDKSSVNQIQLQNLHNGQYTFLSDEAAVSEICAYLDGIIGIDFGSSKGYYEGTYAVTLQFRDTSEYFSVAFGDSSSFSLGQGDDGYPVRYELLNCEIQDVVEFFSQLDSSGFEWAILGQTEATEETEPTFQWGISLKPERVSRTGAAAIFHYSGSVPGEEGAEFTYGDFLSLDRLVDGNWIPCDELAGYNYFVGDSSYPVVDGYGMVHEWPERFGELTDGHYRLGKLVTLERPDGSSESRMVYGAFTLPDSVSIGPIPLEDLPDIYSAEQAMIDGCFVSVDGVARHNQEAFHSFAQNAANGIPGFIRMFNCHYGEDYQWNAMDLSYDGDQFILQGSDTYTFRYLKHFTGEKDRPDVSYDSYEYYVLTNDNTVTWEDILNHRVDAEEHWTVYAEFTYRPKHPDLPDKPDYAILEFADDGLMVITNSDRLEKLVYLFENAEFLGYEPKTHSIGVGLNLIFASGGEELVIELDPDSDVCRINGEYVFYGAPDEPDYIYKLWEYLGITQWPDIVYMVCENALRP